MWTLPGWRATAWSRRARICLRAMLKTSAEALISAEADAACGAPYGRVSEERVNYRNGAPGPAVGYPGRDDSVGAENLRHQAVFVNQVPARSRRRTRKCPGR
jgi:hypothetical protein